MKYAIALAFLVLVAVILLPKIYAPTQGETPLDEAQVVQIARSYVETHLQDTRVTNATVTSLTGSVWKVTVTYEQGNGPSCKVGRCYWEGPAAMFCREESSNSLGTCH